jgi:predicted GNAT superfamily acetyltransferase
MMDIKRRDFIKGCATVSALLLPGIAGAAGGENTNRASASEFRSQVEKSIKANFGGGFSVWDYTHLNGRTYANIEHFGNRYAVASADLLDWKIVRASL